jgi:GLEYA domain
MTGIAAAFVGITAAPNVLYTAGLYNTSLASADQSPITASGSSAGGAISLNYTWIGYYRANTTGSVSLSLQCPYTEFVDGSQQFWGGGGSSVGRLWFGTTAVSGFTNGNANITATNNTASSSVSVANGNYYPIRINWQTSLPYDEEGFFNIDEYYAQSSITFLAGGSSSVSVWYNSRTNGF